MIAQHTGRNHHSLPHRHPRPPTMLLPTTPPKERLTNSLPTSPMKPPKPLSPPPKPSILRPLSPKPNPLSLKPRRLRLPPAPSAPTLQILTSNLKPTMKKMKTFNPIQIFSDMTDTTLARLRLLLSLLLEIIPRLLKIFSRQETPQSPTQPENDRGQSPDGNTPSGN